MYHEVKQKNTCNHNVCKFYCAMVFFAESVRRKTVIRERDSGDRGLSNLAHSPSGSWEKWLCGVCVCVCEVFAWRDRRCVR